MTHEHPDDFDSPWKEALEQALPDFLALFFSPDAHAGIDWSRGYRFRDKELQQVVRDAELGRRYADKLAEVYTLDGAETWVLVLDWILRLPEDLELEFREELIAFEEKEHMPYVTSVERIGIQKGLQQGRREGEAAILLRQIGLKFGPPSEGVRARIEAADADTLLDWSARILTAERVDDIFR